MKKSKKLEKHEIGLLLLCFFQVALVALKTVEIFTVSWWIICLPVSISIAILVALVILIIIHADSIMDGEG